MRIAQICPPWLAVPPKGYGGIEWVVALLADGLVEAGHDVTLFATGDSVTRAHLSSVFRAAPGPTAINDIELDAIHAMHALRDAGGFDVLHVHAPFAAFAGAVASGVPTVHTVHGAFTERMRALYREAADRAWFVAISEAQRRSNDDLRYAGVVHNGVDLDAYPLRTDKDDYVLFLGRAAPEKGWLRAVETCRRSGDRLVSAVKVATPEDVARGLPIGIVAAAAEQRAAVHQEVLEVGALQVGGAVLDDAAPTIAKPDQLRPSFLESPSQTTDRCIEPRRIAAACQHTHSHRHQSRPLSSSSIGYCGPVNGTASAVSVAELDSLPWNPANTSSNSGLLPSKGRTIASKRSRRACRSRCPTSRLEEPSAQWNEARTRTLAPRPPSPYRP